MRRFLILATAVMAVALLTACDGDSTGNGGSIVGTYTLQTFNGMNLPVVIDSVGPGPPQPPTPPQPDIAPSGVIPFMEEITAGSVRLNSDNTCSTSVTFRTTVTDAMGNVTVTTDTETDTCTYSVTGTTIRFDFLPGEAPTTGTISGNTITIVVFGDTFVFTK